MTSGQSLSTGADPIAWGLFVSNVSFASNEEESQSVGLQTNQPTVAEGAAGDDSLVGFFAIGVVINIALVAAYFIWAYRQWKRKK